MIRGHGKKATPKLTKVNTLPTGDVDIVDGLPVTATAVGEDQYGRPFAVTPTGWTSSNPAAVTVSGTATATLTYGGTDGDADIRPVNPAWPAGVVQ